MFKKFNFWLLILTFHFGLLSNPLPNREMIILLETNDEETINKTLEAPNIYRFGEIIHPVGIGSITVSLLVALDQQAAPIIVNRSLIKNLIDHQNLFADCVNLDRQSIFEKYGKYNRFRGRFTLDNFRKNCQLKNNLTPEVNKMLSNLIKDGTNNFDQIFDQIVKNPKFQGDSYPEIRSAMGNTSYTNSVNLEMRTLFLCSQIDLDSNWEIKQVNDDIFLLIPKNYIKKLGINPLQVSAALNKTIFTNLELEFGLKIDHMKTVRRNFFEQKSTGSIRVEIPFIKSLEQIFLTVEDIETANVRNKIKHIWSIHMSGHGMNQELVLNVLPQLYQLKKFYKSKLRSTETLKPEKNISKNIRNHSRIQTYNQKYLNKIQKLDHEIEKIEARKRSNHKVDRAMINSLSISEFRDILKFFNNKIETAFLYYFSCFSAGPHLIEPFQENGKPLKLKYTVLTSNLAENRALQEFPFMNLPPYFDKEQKSIVYPFEINHIDIKQKKLCMTTPLKFDKFFKLLRKGVHRDPNNLILLPYSLHPHVDRFGKIKENRIANIPLVRFANTDHFKPIPTDNSSIILDNKNGTKSITIDKASSLIYSDYISGKVILNKLGKNNEVPKLVSMTPGFACHVFEEINSSTLNLNEIVNSFLTFPELGASKIFWIKKVECINNNGLNIQRNIFKDVIILRNVFNSNTLENCSDQDPLILENCAYFSANDNKESKLTWKGPFLDEFNTKILPCNQISHKEESLNCFPRAKNYLSPVLQSI